MARLTRMAFAVLCVVVLCVTSTGCSKDLSRSRAADLIKQDKGFSEVMDVKVPVGNIWWDWRAINDPDPSYRFKELVKSGVLTIRETGQKEGMWNKEYLVELTDRGRGFSKSWIATKEKMPNGASFMGTACWTDPSNYSTSIPCHTSNGVVYSVVVARMEFGEVTGITARTEDKAATAEFTWKLVPTADAANFSEKVPTESRKGEGHFQLFDDGWRLTEINVKD